MVKYTDEDIKLGKQIQDFLPTPDELVLKESKVKITLELSEKSISFFKKQAKKHKVPYQAMIRSLIDKYVEKHETS